MVLNKCGEFIDQWQCFELDLIVAKFPVGISCFKNNITSRLENATLFWILELPRFMMKTFRQVKINENNLNAATSKNDLENFGMYKWITNNIVHYDPLMMSQKEAPRKHSGVLWFEFPAIIGLW